MNTSPSQSANIAKLKEALFDVTMTDSQGSTKHLHGGTMHRLFDTVLVQWRVAKAKGFNLQHLHHCNREAGFTIYTHIDY